LSFRYACVRSEADADYFGAAVGTEAAAGAGAFEFQMRRIIRH
jgi:hypothetical protein